MNRPIYLLTLIIISLTTACTGAGQNTPASFSIVTLSPERATSSSVSTPMATSDNTFTLIPRCDGYESLDGPVQFAWPQIEERLKELEGSYWIYSSCPQPQVTVAAFYRERMVKPPYNMDEMNWVSRSGGNLGVYFYLTTGDWTYLWVVPQPENEQATYVIAAITNGQPFQGGECRLDSFGERTAFTWFGWTSD